ncbi:chorion class B protein B.L1 [Plutella xylostella]|uniref:chorion class B protein B.L1 n=1 Tax=Plutella xylostella TaxID=51655 RepID=UPI00203235A4|nr:chorion class B protein B.L1 [Plutella xylostella]
MVSKAFIVVCTVALVQAVYGQCGCGLNNYAPVVNQVSPVVGCGSNLGINGLGINNLGINNYAGLNSYGNIGNAISYPESVLSISSGSYVTPNGISILAENLEIGGQVGVAGSMPFVGAVSMGGVAPTSGQATVAYNSAPGVGLTDAGCGQGLAGNGYGLGNGLVGNGYGIGNGLIGNGLIGNGLIGNGVGCGNVGYIGNNLGNNVGCGCY